MLEKRRRKAVADSSDSLFAAWSDDLLDKLWIPDPEPAGPDDPPLAEEFANENLQSDVRQSAGSVALLEAPPQKTAPVVGGSPDPATRPTAGLPPRPRKAARVFAVQPAADVVPPIPKAPARHRGWTLFFSLLMLLGGVLGFVGLSQDDGPATKPIKQIHAGGMVWVAPAAGEEDTQFGMEVDPPTWRLLRLKAPKRDGSWAAVELLRPMWWLEQKQVKAGGTVDISVPECGIDGRAEVLSVSPCPDIGEVPDGYRVVTGRFVHHHARVIDLHVGGFLARSGLTVERY